MLAVLRRTVPISRRWWSIVAVLVLTAGLLEVTALARAQDNKPTVPEVSQGHGPVTPAALLVSTPRHGLPAGKEPPIVPPPIKSTGKASARPAVHRDGPTGPRATNLVLLPGLVAGDTSLELYLDAPPSGWAQGTITLFAASDPATPLHAATFDPTTLTVCKSPAQYCYTLDNAHDWALTAGVSYTVTVTLTTADGQATDSDPSRPATPRVLPTPPAVPPAQVRGSGGGSSGATGLVVLRGADVNVATGGFTQQLTDARMTSAYDVNVVALRAYNSLDTSAGLMGVGWFFDYEAHVAPEADPAKVDYVSEDGTTFTYTRNADGSYTAPPGARATLTAQSGGGWQVATPGQQRLTFDAAGRLLSIRNERGKGVTLGYTAGRLTSVTDAGGRVLTVTTQDPGRITAITLPDGRKTTYTYTNDRLTSVHDADGAVLTYGYDAAGRLATLTDPLGHKQLTNAYDPTSGRVTAQQDTFGKTTRFEWVPGSDGAMESRVTDPDGVVTRDGFKGNVLLYSRNGNLDTNVYRYDSQLNLQVTNEPRGSQVESGFDGHGNVTSRTVFSPADPVHSAATYDPANNVLTRTDPRGHLVSYTYNQFNQPVTGTDGEGHVTKFTYYDDSGLLKSMTDGLGHTTTYVYDAVGDTVSVTDPTGAKTTNTFDGTGRMTATTDPLGHSTTFDVYDAHDRVRKQTDPLGHFVLSEYDNAGRLVTKTDANNAHTTYVYDNANRVIKQIDPDLRTTTFAYTDGSRLRTRTDGAGDVLRYTYDLAGRLATTVSPRGNVAGADPGQFTTTYAYDFNGNEVSESHPYPGGGTVTSTYTYDTRDERVSVTNGLGQTTRYAYDESGNVAQVTDPLGHTTVTTYDGNNQVKTVTDGLGHTTTYGYDAGANLVSQTAPSGAKTTYAYDDADRLVAMTSPRGNVSGANPAAFTTKYGYDAAGRRTSSTDPLGQIDSVGYDAAGRITRKVDANGHATRYTYDAAGRLTRILGPDAANDTQATVNDYDHSGNLIARTDPLGFTQRLTYDAAGRLQSSTDAIGNRREVSYDADGNVATVVTARGTSQGSQAARDAATIVQRYDVLDRLSERVLGNGAAYSFGYDAAGRLTNLADASGQQVRGYDAAGDLTSVTRAGTAFGYTYDAGGNLVTRTMPDASAQTLGYDVDSRPATLTTSLGTTRYAVDPDGNVTQVTTPGGTVEARTYDNADRLAKLTVTGPAQQAITGYTLRRDKVGNPTRVDTTLGSASRSDAFTYDKADRLTAMCYQVTTCSGASNKLSFTYDLVGNRTAKKKSGSGSFTEKYTYNAADQLQTRSGGPDGTQSYSYDQDGNTTQISSVKYGYDLDNHLSSVDDGKKHTTYTTDGAGNRLSADTTPGSGGTTTHTGYQWDVNAVLPLLASEQTGSSTTKYTYQPGGAPYTQQSGANTTLLFPDPFGNTTALTDPSGAVQRLFQLTDPFGGLQATASSGASTRLGFQGQYNDPLSSSYHLRDRDYTIATGRFTSVDPMANGVDQPAVAGYVYGDDNPLTHADPSGDCDWWDVQCRVTEKIYNLWQYETDGTPHTAQDRERDFGAGIIRSGAETIDGVWNGIVGIYNWNQHWQDKPGLPDSVKLHLADDWDKFAGEHLGVDTNSPYYNYGAITGTVLQLFIPIGGDEAVGGRWLGGLLGRVAEKLRVPKWEPKPTVPKDEPKPPAPKPKPPTGSLEGERDFVVDDPNVPGRTITDIDHIEGNTLWEEKSATRAGNIQDWVNKHIIRKFNSYLDARQYLPAFYHNARIGFRFTSPGMDPTLRSAIDSAVAQLRQAHPNVEIVTEFA